MFDDSGEFLEFVHSLLKCLVAAPSPLHYKSCFDGFLEKCEKQSEYHFDVGFQLVEALEANPHNSTTVINNFYGPIMTGDQISNSVGGDQIGSSVGKENNVEITDSTVLNRSIQKLEQVDGDLKQHLFAANEAIRRLELEAQVQAELVKNLEKLVSELAKQEPSKNMLQYLWSGLSQFASSAKPILDLGTKLATLYGISVT